MIPLLVPIGLGLIGGYLTKESHEMFENGGGVSQTDAPHLQMSNLDKKSAEQNAEIFKNYNNVVKIVKQDNGRYSIYTSSISGDKSFAGGGGVEKRKFYKLKYWETEEDMNRGESMGVKPLS